MKTRLLNFWEKISSSFWVIPSLMVGAAVVLSGLTVGIDRSIGFESSGFGRLLYMGGAEGASAILSTIAGSMITVAGVVFSIIIVALTMTSAQFGSRLLRNFVRDKGNQLVLGTFISTFTYCLLALRAIYTAEGGSFVASVSVTFAMVLALINVGVLIYFIHHVSTSIQAEQVIASVYRELWERMERYFPETLEAAPPAPDDGGNGTENGEGSDGRCEIESGRSGYVQAIDVHGLIEFAAEHNLIIETSRGPGDFVVPGGPLATVYWRDEPEDGMKQRIVNAFILGTHRTPEQDPEFAIHQLVEIAIRALSPGINAPFTAMTCVDQLGSILCYLTQRAFPPAARFDAEGRLRVRLKALTFEGVTEAAFNQIRQYSRTSVAVTIRLLEALGNVARQTRTEEQRAAVRRQAEMIARASEDALPEENDRKDVAAQYEAVMAALEGDRDGGRRRGKGNETGFTG